MSMPGFTAEASIYETSERYYMTGTGATSTAQVVPAVLCCQANCYWYCNKNGWNTQWCGQCWSLCNIQC
jgi:hypothetical protein